MIVHNDYIKMNNTYYQIWHDDLINFFEEKIQSQTYVYYMLNDIIKINKNNNDDF